jgi:hypothetical protein
LEGKRKERERRTEDKRLGGRRGELRNEIERCERRENLHEERR